MDQMELKIEKLEHHVRQGQSIQLVTTHDTDTYVQARKRHRSTKSKSDGPEWEWICSARSKPRSEAETTIEQNKPGEVPGSDVEMEVEVRHYYDGQEKRKVGGKEKQRT